MKLGELLKGVKIKEIKADLNIEIKGVCYDSRKCGEGYAFFARKGLTYDGFKFIPACFKKGVSVFFGEEGFEDYPCIVVEDILEAQAIVSANFYGNPQNFLNIVGVIFIALDKNGNVALINKKGCEVLEYPEDKILGKNWFDNFLPKDIRGETKNIF